MKVLLDENLSHRLRLFIAGHDVFTVDFMKWKGVKNGRLLALAAADGFEAMITLDDGIAYQTNLTALPIAVIVLSAPSSALEDLLPLVVDILRALREVSRPCVVRVPLLSSGNP